LGGVTLSVILVGDWSPLNSESWLSPPAHFIVVLFGWKSNTLMCEGHVKLHILEDMKQLDLTLEQYFLKL